MEKLTLVLTKLRETKNKVVYGEKGEPVVVESLYLPKTVVGNPAPAGIRIQLEEIS